MQRSLTTDLSGSFETLQSMRARDKVRPGWQSPVCAGTFEARFHSLHRI